jgi:delta-aminolevulinic acid dehydratase/porphobilinogen synthase
VLPYIRKARSTPGSIDDPSYWYQRAEESRAMAQELHDPQSKAAMLKVAASYLDLARQAASRSKFP